MNRRRQDLWIDRVTIIFRVKEPSKRILFGCWWCLELVLTSCEKWRYYVFSRLKDISLWIIYKIPKIRYLSVHKRKRAKMLGNFWVFNKNRVSVCFCPVRHLNRGPVSDTGDGITLLTQELSYVVPYLKDQL